jgi:hypothetical protein
MIQKANRLVSIWSERKLFPSEAILAFKSKIRMWIRLACHKNASIVIWCDHLIAAAGTPQAKKPASKTTDSSPKKSVSFAAMPETLAPDASHPISQAVFKIKAIEKKRLVQGGEMAAGINASLTDASFISQGKGGLFNIC